MDNLPSETTCGAKKTRRIRCGTVVAGVAVAIGGIFFLLHLTGNPLDELALIRRAEIATGVFGEQFEDLVEGEAGRSGVLTVSVYTYRVPDGREFKVSTNSPDAVFGEETQVEYLPDDPAVSRIKGDGCQSIAEWIWRKAALGTFLMAFCVGLGVVIIVEGSRGRSH